jgi:hypothetical protein
MGQRERERDSAARGWRRPRRVVAAAVLVVAGLLTLLPSLAPATITEQRNRLPPPAFCEDEVEGIWRSHSYWEHHGQWYLFTMEVRRVKGEPNRLQGHIVSHYWAGGPRDEEPPVCAPGGYRQIVRMPGAGNIANGMVTFGGTSWTLEQTFCGPPTANYYPDVFSGRIDPALQEFQSVNNDGGPAVNVPQVFRRIRCLDPESQPHVTVTPPAFYLPERGGCGLF